MSQKPTDVPDVIGNDFRISSDELSMIFKLGRTFLWKVLCVNPYYSVKITAPRVISKSDPEFFEGGAIEHIPLKPKKYMWRKLHAVSQSICPSVNSKIRDEGAK
ncbi:uncharacterized [Tachysurus ichikawai]